MKIIFSKNEKGKKEIEKIDKILNHGVFEIIDRVLFLDSSRLVLQIMKEVLYKRVINNYEKE